jgi:mRNA interferase MazF
VRPRARRSGRGGTGAYRPDRAHFAYLDFTPHAGTERGGRRSALTLSPIEYNVATGRAFACPVTNQVKGSLFEVVVPAGARVTRVILADQMRNPDWLARTAEFYGVAEPATLSDVLARIEAILAI